LTLFDDILAQFHPDVQATVRKIWDALGPAEKASFQSLLSGFPTDTNLVRRLVKLSTAQIRQAFGQKGLQQSVTQSLENLPLAESQTELDREAGE
jgi:hypothetical protein